MLHHSVFANYDQSICWKNVWKETTQRYFLTETHIFINFIIHSFFAVEGGGLYTHDGLKKAGYDVQHKKRLHIDKKRYGISEFPNS